MVVQLAAKGQDSIAQCIRTLLLTGKGEIPFKPEMGIGSHALLDGNLDRLKISLEITNQINTYEPRITVKQVMILPSDNVGELRIAIKYKIKESGEEAAYFFNN
jgi:phage baseplate assembly protein W